MPSQCASGEGVWILGNRVDGTQAEYVRIPHASFSLHALPESIEPKSRLRCRIRSRLLVNVGFGTGISSPGLPSQFSELVRWLMVLQMAKKLFGPAMTVVVGRVQPRLETARRL